MKGGERKKKYVGNHPLRVAEARQKLRNYKDRLSCILTQEKVKADLDEIEAVIHHLLEICSRFDLVARFALQEEQNGDKDISSRRGSADVVYPNVSHTVGME